MTNPSPKKARKRKQKTPMDVPITHPEFFTKLGSRGGLATRDRHPKDYFARIAIISHQVRRERAAELARESAANNGKH